MPKLIAKGQEGTINLKQERCFLQGESSTERQVHAVKVSKGA